MEISCAIKGEKEYDFILNYIRNLISQRRIQKCQIS